MEAIIMLGDGRQFTPPELGALGIGAAVTAGMSYITIVVSPIPFPFNVLISLVLGVTAGYGAYMILVRPPEVEIEDQIIADYRAKLTKIRGIAERIGDISQSGCLRPEIAAQLSEVNRLIQLILQRFETDRNIPLASATVLFLERFLSVLEDYHSIQCGELFLSDEEKAEKIKDFEDRILPLTLTALHNLGRKLDEARVTRNEVSADTLEDIIEALGLMETYKKQLGEPPKEEKDDDERTD